MHWSIIIVKNAKGSKKFNSIERIRREMIEQKFFFSIFSICGDYEAIKQRALTKPTTTAELNDIVKYIDNAKGERSLNLVRRIKVCLTFSRNDVFKSKKTMSRRKFNDKWNIYWKNISSQRKTFI